jgi:hypothetical protein
MAAFMAASLPKDATPQIKGPYDAVALAVHAGMIAVGFKLIGLGEDHRIGKFAVNSYKASSANPLSEAHSEASETQPLPSEWNASSSYAFRYTHNQSSMEFIIKVGRLGAKATVDGIAIGDDKRTSFDFPVKDFVSEGNLPATPVEDSASTEQASRKMQDIFISAGRLSDLGDLLKVNIIQKLIPNVTKEGYEEAAQTTDSSSGRRDPQAGYPRREGDDRPDYDPLRAEQPPARPHPFHDPDAPGRPFPPGLEPPGFDDEYDLLRGPRGGGFGGNRNPLNIGHDDLYPAGMGPNDPFGGNLGPGGLPRPGGGGGMHPSFDDPLFGGRGGEGRRGDPQAPGGARYDPVFPGDPRGGPGNFAGAGHRGPHGGNPFGGFGGADFI